MYNMEFDMCTIQYNNVTNEEYHLNDSDNLYKVYKI
jgi:hypothetical protein